MDTLRRWDRAGRIRTVRDGANHRLVPSSEVDRLLAERAAPVATRTGSARNRIAGTITKVTVEGLLARVELEVRDPARLVAVITSEAVEDLGLEVGSNAVAVVKATSMMIEAGE